MDAKEQGYQRFWNKWADIHLKNIEHELVQLSITLDKVDITDEVQDRLEHCEAVMTRLASFRAEDLQAVAREVA